jgi:hypothetical protein
MRTPIRLSRWALIALFPLVAACAFNAGYNPNFVGEPLAVAAKLPGKALVYMSPEDAKYAFSGKPTSFTGGGTNLTIQLGEITQRVAVKVFGEVFVDGADAATRLDDIAGYRVVIEPRITHYSYAYNQLRNLGFAVTPEVDMTLSVKVVDGTARVVLEQAFAHDDYRGKSSEISGAPGENVSQATHAALTELMNNAASALIAQLAR